MIGGTLLFVAPNESRKKALVIAVSKYTDKEHLQNLNFCQNDGKEMYKILKKIGYELTQTQKIVGKVNAATMRSAVYDFLRKGVTPSDTLLFYFTGHGYTDGFGDGFFCTSDIDITSPDRNGISFHYLTEQMDKSESQRIIAILDCCNSGATLQSNIGRAMGPDEKEKKAVQQGRASLEKEFMQGQGRCILASSLSNRESYGLEDKPFSAFTYYILEGLKRNKETVDEYGHITPDKLSLYVSTELQKLQGSNYQKPVRHLSITDKIVLAEYPDMADVGSIEEKLISLLREGNKKDYQILKQQNPERILDLDGFVFPEDMDLRGIDLVRASLVGVDFFRKDLEGALFTDADLSTAILNEANLKKADFQHCKIIGARLVRANLEEAVLRLCDLTNSDCTGTNFTKCIDFSTAVLAQTILQDAIFNSTPLQTCNFSGKMNGAKFIRANLQDATFNVAELKEADFTNAEAIGVKFLYCVLHKTKFKDTNMIASKFLRGPCHIEIDMSGAKLNEATFTDFNSSKLNLSNTQLYKTSFIRSNLDQPNFTDAQVGGVNLQFTQINNPIPKNFKLNGTDEPDVRKYKT